MSYWHILRVTLCLHNKSVSTNICFRITLNRTTIVFLYACLLRGHWITKSQKPTHVLQRTSWIDPVVKGWLKDSYYRLLVSWLYLFCGDQTMPATSAGQWRPPWCQTMQPLYRRSLRTRWQMKHS